LDGGCYLWREADMKQHGMDTAQSGQIQISMQRSTKFDFPLGAHVKLF